MDGDSVIQHTPYYGSSYQNVNWKNNKIDKWFSDGVFSKKARKISYFMDLNDPLNNLT